MSDGDRQYVCFVVSVPTDDNPAIQWEIIDETEDDVRNEVSDWPRIKIAREPWVLDGHEDGDDREKAVAALKSRPDVQAIMAMVTTPPVYTGDDTVDHPHYYGGKDNPYEAIKVIFALGWGRGFCLGNTLKYMTRAGSKHDDALHDLKKAAWYLDAYVRHLENDW